jgi:glucans biosynthesis protein
VGLRTLVTVLITICVIVPITAQVTSAATRFSFAEVRQRAAELARRPYVDDKSPMPEAVRNLSYDQYRKIGFRQNKALWRDEALPFEVHFFQRASFSFMPPFDKVMVNVVDQGKVVPVPYSSDLFDFGRPVAPKLPSNMGFAGLRFHYPSHQDNQHEIVFLGASYFRVKGLNQHYGISARGLAIDTGLSKKEEFPRFREFWLEKPNREATAEPFYVLMDSPSATGAYQITIRPRTDTVLEVKAHVFMRHDVERIGFAPLTSMFFRGEGTDRFLDDFRPEVHDSDGLLMATGHGEWIWRPLDNPTRLRVSSFRDTNPRGFGLLQRDRNFDHYQDLESVFEKRPSAWVEPLGDWGKGVVQLVEIPTDADWNDNMVAFWVPDERAKAGKEWRFEYRIYFSLEKPGLPPVGRTYATRVGRGGVGGVIEPNKRKFAIDFVGGQLKELSVDTPVAAVVSASLGEIDNQSVQKNGFIDGWRVFFELQPDGNAPVELRCFLKHGDDALTETWSYLWDPKKPFLQ